MKSCVAVATASVLTLFCVVHAEQIGSPKTFRGRIDGCRGAGQSYTVPVGSSTIRSATQPTKDCTSPLSNFNRYQKNKQEILIAPVYIFAFYCIHSCRSKMLLLVVAVAAIVQGQVAPTITADGESITAEATDLVRFQ